MVSTTDKEEDKISSDFVQSILRTHLTSDANNLFAANQFLAVYLIETYNIHR